jgi:16S rRNA processing protein RimM
LEKPTILPESDDLVLIGYSRSPFGLTGEIKVKPETHDISRHSLLKQVFFKKTPGSAIIELEVEGSRLHMNLWYLKFKGYGSPEQAKMLSGGMLFIHKKDRLPAPDESFYPDELIGFTARDQNNQTLGRVEGIQESPGQDLFIVNRNKEKRIRKEQLSSTDTMLIPWNDIFVNNIDMEQKIISFDVSRLEGLYED